MVSSQNASNFLSNNENSTNDTTRVSKGEELKEVASQLGFLRKHHDVKKTINAMRLKTLTLKSYDLKAVEESSAITGTVFENARNRVKELEKEIEKIKKLQEDHNFDTFSYRHIIERMRFTRINLDAKNLALNKYLKNSSQILFHELNKKRTVREARIQTKVAVKNLESFIIRETKEKTEELEVLKKDVKQKKDSSHKREERFRRQVEILEAAADEDRNMRAMQLREGLLLNMLWFSVLQKKLINDRKRFYKLETAFDNVKKATGLHETQEVIQKLLTREALYTEILETVSYTKGKIGEFSNKNKEIEDKLNLLNIIKNETPNPAKILGQEVTKKVKEIEFNHEKLRKITSVYNNISG